MASVKNIAILTCMLGSLGTLAVVLLGLGGPSRAEIDYAHSMIATAPKPESEEQHQLSAVERFMQGRALMSRRAGMPGAPGGAVTSGGSLKEGLAAMKAMLARRESLAAPDPIRDWHEGMLACDRTAIDLLTQASALPNEEGEAFPPESAELQNLRSQYRTNFSRRTELLKDPRWHACLKARGREP